MTNALGRVILAAGAVFTVFANGYASEREGTSERVQKRIRGEKKETNDSSIWRVPSGRRAGAVKRHAPDNDHINIRVVVTYEDDKAKQRVLHVAKDLIKSYNNVNKMVVLLDYSTYHLLKDTGISMERDVPVKGLSITETPLDFDVDTERQLRERVNYGIKMVQADQIEVGPHPPTVCLCDTGYAIGHYDLPKENVTGDSAYDAFGGVDDWRWDKDLNGHGSHIAGVVAALSGNGKGVSSVAAGLKLHITRGLSDESTAYESDILDAVEQCAASGAKIISLSLGGGGMTDRASALYKDLVQNQGILIFAAAGNDGKRRHSYPASHPDVVSVSAVYESEQYWEGSNYNPQVELAAPGYRILSTTVSNSAVHSASFSYPAFQLHYSIGLEASGKLVYCGTGETGCLNPDKEDIICLMIRESHTDLKTIISNCQESGGIGALIFSDGTANGGWAATTAIPAVAVTRSRGLEILFNYEGENITIGHMDDDEPEYTYSYFTGTSMATPHAAAVAGLIWSHFPDCSNHQIRYALAASAKDAGLNGCDWDYGYGIVQAKDAYDFLLEHGCKEEFRERSKGGCSTLE